MAPSTAQIENQGLFSLNNTSREESETSSEYIGNHSK